MFFSREAHDLIVATLKESHDSQIAELKKAHELVVGELRNQVANLTGERDHYRKEWTRARGKAFTKPGEVEQTMPLFDQQPLTPPPIDADWNEDDRDIFRDWAAELPNGVNAE